LFVAFSPFALLSRWLLIVEQHPCVCVALGTDTFLDWFTPGRGFPWSSWAAQPASEGVLRKVRRKIQRKTNCA
jgi:hypothetical protein